MKYLLFLLFPLTSLAQVVPRVRPQVIPQRDSANEMQYAINSKVYNNGQTETVNLFNVRNGNWISFPHSLVMFKGYAGRNSGRIDTILHHNNGNIRASPVDSLYIKWGNVTGKPSFFSGAYADLTGKPSIPTMFADSIQYYNASGRIYQRIKKWVGRVAVTSASGQTVDISSCGCSTILSIVATAEKNGTASTASPNVAIKSYSTSSVTLNFTEANGAVVSILGINVLSGLPLIFASTTGLFVHVEVTCY